VEQNETQMSSDGAQLRPSPTVKLSREAPAVVMAVVMARGGMVALHKEVMSLDESVMSFVMSVICTDRKLIEKVSGEG